MVFADATPVPAVDFFLQYGSFGMLAVLFVWVLRVGLPKMLDTHREAITALVESQKEENQSCREERVQVTKESAAEREKDRELRHEFKNQMHEFASQMSKVAELLEKKT